MQADGDKCPAGVPSTIDIEVLSVSSRRPPRRSATWRDLSATWNWKRHSAARERIAVQMPNVLRTYRRSLAMRAG